MITNLSQVLPATALKARESTTPVSPSPAADVVTEPVASIKTAGTVAAQTDAIPGMRAGSADEALSAAVDHLNAKAQNLNRNLEFSLEKDSGKLVVKVVDAQTHEIIRQIPRKEALELARSIEQYMQDHHMGLIKTQA